MIWTLLLAAAAGVAIGSAFFDQARLTRRGTVYKLAGGDRSVALTFDDGPDPRWTPQILAVLRRHGVKATFFLVGDNVRRHPDVARAVADAGHTVANHSARHRPLWRLGKRAALREMREADAAIRAACGRAARLFRPPKGLLWPHQKRWISGAGFTPVLWSVNAKDWAGFSARRLAATVARRTGAGDIVLFHDGGGVFAARGGDRSATVAAVDALIAELKGRGLSFVALDEAPAA